MELSLSVMGNIKELTCSKILKSFLEFPKDIFFLKIPINVFEIFIFELSVFTEVPNLGQIKLLS